MDREKFKEILAPIVSNLRRSPEGFDGKCPYHEGFHKSKANSLSINLHKGVFFCQSAVCGATGPLWKLLVDCGHWSMSQARGIQDWCREAVNIDTLKVPAWDARLEQPHEDTPKVSRALLALYRKCPVFLLEQGYSKDILRQWDVGFSEDRYAVTFPVWSVDGDLVGFSYRSVDEARTSRYANEFPKGLFLYGEHRVRRDVPGVTVMESQKSVLRSSQDGVENVLATFGAKVSDAQVKKIAAFSRGEVTLAFDVDMGGLAATYFTGSRLLRLGTRVFVVDGFEGGKDPSEVERPSKSFAKKVEFLSWLNRVRDVLPLRNTLFSKHSRPRNGYRKVG
jgi:DNA primase